MALTPLQSCVSVSFETLLDLPHYSTESAQSALSTKRLNKHLYLENKIVAACRKNQHDEAFYPVMFCCAQGFQDLVLNGYEAQEVMNDVLFPRETSETFGEIRRKQMDLLLPSHECLRYYQTPNIYTILAKQNIRSKTRIIDDFTKTVNNLTTHEYNAFGNLVQKVDALKEGIALASGQYRMPDRLLIYPRDLQSSDFNPE